MPQTANAMPIQTREDDGDDDSGWLFSGRNVLRAGAVCAAVALATIGWALQTTPSEAIAAASPCVQAAVGARSSGIKDGVRNFELHRFQEGCGETLLARLAGHPKPTCPAGR